MFEVSGAAMVCEASATMTTKGGNTAQITAYDVKEASCVGLAGNLEGCEVTAATPKDLPWSVAVNTADLTAKEVKVDYSFDKACGIQKIEVSFPSLTLTPEEPSAIRLFHFNQEGTAKVDGKEALFNNGGSLSLPEELFDKYGIG